MLTTPVSQNINSSVRKRDTSKSSQFRVLTTPAPNFFPSLPPLRPYSATRTSPSKSNGPQPPTLLQDNTRFEYQHPLSLLSSAHGAREESIRDVPPHGSSAGQKAGPAGSAPAVMKKTRRRSGLRCGARRSVDCAGGRRSRGRSRSEEGSVTASQRTASNRLA